MEHFSQKDVDRMIQEAAQAAKNKNGSSDGGTAKPAGAKPVSNVTAPPQQPVDPVEEVLASMNQTPSAKTKEPEQAEAEKTPTEDVKPDTTAPAQEPAAEATEQTASAEPVAEKVAEKTPEPIEAHPEPKQVQEEAQAEKIAQPESEIENIKIQETKPIHNSQPTVPEPQTVQSAATDIDPAFAALSSEQVYTFVMALIKDLADAKVELAKMQVDLEIEKLENQAASFFKNTK